MILEKLRALSEEALYDMAEKMNLDLPPGLPAALVISELMDAYDEDARERMQSSSGATGVEEKKFSGPASDIIDASFPLPHALEPRYNETRIHLLPRDPEWLFTFWDVNDEEMDGIRAEGSYQGLSLRVSSVEGGESFDVPVSDGDRSWYLHSGGVPGMYRVDLCAHVGNKVRAIARSESVETPSTGYAIDLSGMSKPQRALVLIASGAGDQPDQEIADTGNPFRIMSRQADVE